MDPTLQTPASDFKQFHNMAKKRKRHFNEFQLRVLKSVFERYPYPSRVEKINLIEKVGLTYNQISSWFIRYRKQLKKRSKIHISYWNSFSPLLESRKLHSDLSCTATCIYHYYSHVQLRFVYWTEISPYILYVYT